MGGGQSKPKKEGGPCTLFLLLFFVSMRGVLLVRSFYQSPFFFSAPLFTSHLGSLVVSFLLALPFSKFSPFF